MSTNVALNGQRAAERQNYLPWLFLGIVGSFSAQSSCTQAHRPSRPTCLPPAPLTRTSNRSS